MSDCMTFSGTISVFWWVISCCVLRCTFLWKKNKKKQRQYSVEFKLCAILDKLENGLNYIDVGIIAPPQWPHFRTWTSRSNEQSMNVWRTSLIISTNSRKFASNILSRMNTKAAGQSLRFPARSKKHLPQTEPSSWLMVAK